MQSGSTVPQLTSPIPLADVSSTSFDLSGELETEIDMNTPVEELPPIPRGPPVEHQLVGSSLESNEELRSQAPQPYAKASTSASTTSLPTRPAMQVVGQPRRTLALQNSDPTAPAPRRNSRSPIRAQSVMTATSSDRLLAGTMNRRLLKRSEVPDMNSRDREIMNLRAQLSLQEQQMTVIFQQARQSAAANAHAETTVVAQQASQFQGLISEFQSELAMSQLKGEQ